MLIQENTILAHLSPFSRDERNTRRYVRFIETLSSIPTRGNVKHHILPKSMFPEFAKSPDNIISLTEREHYIAHLLLWKAVGGKMTYAFRFMRHLVKNSREYDSLTKEYRNIHSERMSGENNPMFGVVGTNHPCYGVPFSEERRESISKRVTGTGNPMYGKYGEDHPKFGHTHSEETRRRQSESNAAFYENNEEAREMVSIRQTEIWKSEELRQKARDAKIGEKNPNFGKDITNSLTEEANARRERNAKENLRAWHKENPTWCRLTKDDPRFILWSLAPQIIESTKGSTTLSRDLVGDKKYFNTILRIKQLSEDGWIPIEDERWVAVFGNTYKPFVEESTTLENFI